MDNHVGLPKNWTFVFFPQAIFFLFFGDNISIPTKTIMTKEDMSTEIRCNGVLVTEKLLDIVRNIGNIFPINICSKTRALHVLSGKTSTRKQGKKFKNTVKRKAI